MQGSTVTETQQMIGRIPDRWRALSGGDKWKDLLDPLDIDLRRYLIHYGERANSTYDAFNWNPVSKYAGDSKYARKHFFSRVGLDKGNPFKYNVVRFLYATSSFPLPAAFIFKSLCRESWHKESNWIGYVAVATDEGKAALGRRDILIAWRGTVRAAEWVKDFEFPLVSASKIFPATNVNVHKGWLSMYWSSNERSAYCKASARDQVLEEVEQLLEKYHDEEVSLTITGHSLGAALSILNAADIVANGFNKLKDQPTKSCPVTAIAFGCPYVGDIEFKQMCDSMGDNLHMLRIRNFPDQIPEYPTVILGYRSVGEELVIDSHQSKYLKFPGNLVSWHYMEVYLHVIAGTQGSKGGFKLEVKRDIALLNKVLGVLRKQYREQYLVPVRWWCLKNKGMVQGENGKWKLEDHETDEDD